MVIFSTVLSMLPVLNEFVVPFMKEAEHISFPSGLEFIRLAYLVNRMKRSIPVSPESRQYKASFHPIGLHDAYYIFMKNMLRAQKQGGQEISKPDPQ